jgi:hypothetical protein
MQFLWVCLNTLSLSSMLTSIRASFPHPPSCHRLGRSRSAALLCAYYRKQAQMNSKKYYIDRNPRQVWIMNQPTILALAIVFSSVLIVSGTNICDNAPCETQINASLGKELESNPSTGFEFLYLKASFP